MNWNVVGAILGLIIIALAWYLFLKLINRKKKETTAPSGPRPTADVMPLGPGISVIIPRTLTAHMPHNLGMGNEKYRAQIRNLFLQVFGLAPAQFSETNFTWAQWLGLNSPRKREPRDLIDLVLSDVKDPFKARALTILLVPALRFSPFLWDGEDNLDWNYLCTDKIDPASFSKELLQFFGELLKINVDAVLSTEFNEKLFNTLCTYNRCILQMLAILPEDDPLADELFKRYPLNDPVGFSGMEDSSGYNPLSDLFNANIPENYKWLADIKMQQVIRSEESGWITPRYEWENALKCYINMIQLHFYGKFPYGKELLATQMGFVLSLPNLKNRALLQNYHLGGFLEALSGENYRQLRHNIARYIVLENREAEYGDFRIYDDSTSKSAKIVLEEFGTEDEELRVRIETLTAEAREHFRKSGESQTAQKQKADLVISKMK